MKIDENGRAHVPGLGRPGALRGGCTDRFAELLGGAHTELTAAVGDLTQVMRRMAPFVLGVQTVILDINGQGSVNYRVPYGCVFVDSASTHVLTIANAPLQSAAPGGGPGVAFVRIGGNRLVNFQSNVLSIYGGQAGELVTVEAFGHPLAPTSR